MATYQKRNGRITATVRIKPHPPKSKTHDTMREAKKWAQELEVKLKNEKAEIFDHVIWKDVLLEYRDTVSINKKGADKEIRKINYLLKNMYVDLPLLEVNKEFLIDWREKRLKSVKGATVRRDLILLSAIFTWCIDIKRWMGTNPIRDIKLPKESPHRERVISDEEVEIILPFLSTEMKFIFLIALETGMRLSEICNLKWERIHLQKNYLVLDATKNGRAREVPLSNKAVNIFKEIGPLKQGNVFEISNDDATTEFMKSRVAAGLTGFKFHDSRHTAATRIALKIPLLDLCKMFGWTNPRRAMIYYNPTSSEIAERLSQQ
ncbi:integrase [Acinetobacter sp. NRRL B-65365]|uniref:tyrosine-type recombinase/integrase n=1 Tax=Acinetobacter sp. NRRL B-65365 TaxID=1785092 RepID=UPI0007A08356|nr:site-specific integrase [Acinetobacter sp. NRRL B-65365]KYQ82494.1 integrase [Acinetobacter sp. NRRL B-65365]